MANGEGNGRIQFENVVLRAIAFDLSFPVLAFGSGPVYIWIMALTTLHLAKQNFKFSSAHFLIFDDQHAEKLHGHNYQVKVDIVVPQELDLNEQGFFIDFNVFKKHIKARLDLWDEMVLLPALHKDMKITEKSPSLEVRFRERFYVFPQNEVVLLPITNTSVEQLSRILAEEFYSHFKLYHVKKVRVSVEETRGQGAWTDAGEGI